MPGVVVSHEGASELIRIDLSAALVSPRTWFLALFKNDVDPTRATTRGMLTDATFSGYFPIGLDPAKWQTPVIVGDQAVSYYDTDYQTWLATSGTQIIYGYMVLFNSGSNLLWSERYLNPVTVSTTNPVRAWPVFTGQSLFPII